MMKKLKYYKKKSAKQVGRPIFFFALVLVVVFLPIFGLTGQEEDYFTL